MNQSTNNRKPGSDRSKLKRSLLAVIIGRRECDFHTLRDAVPEFVAGDVRRALESLIAIELVDFDESTGIYRVPDYRRDRARDLVTAGTSANHKAA